MEACRAFTRLHNIWKSNTASKPTSTCLTPWSSRIFYTGLSAGEKLNATFHNDYLRKINSIFCPNTTSNKELYIKTGCWSMISEIKHCHLRWLGHILQMPTEQIPKVALKWTSPGSRKPGRPKIPWRRTVEAELLEMDIWWGEPELAAKCHDRNITDALCPKDWLDWLTCTIIVQYISGNYHCTVYILPLHCGYILLYMWNAFSPMQ